MRVLNVDKLKEAIEVLLKDIAPTDRELTADSRVFVYWSAVQVATQIILAAIKNSSEEQNVE